MNKSIRFMTNVLKSQHTVCSTCTKRRLKHGGFLGYKATGYFNSLISLKIVVLANLQGEKKNIGQGWNFSLASHLQRKGLGSSVIFAWRFSLFLETGSLKRKGPQITPKWGRWRSFLISLFVLVIMVPRSWFNQNLSKKRSFKYCFILLINGRVTWPNSIRQYSPCTVC